MFGYVTNSKNALFSLMVGDRPVWVCGLGICGASCILVPNTDTPNDSSHSPPLYRLGLYGVISVDSLDEYGQWEMRRGGLRGRDRFCLLFLVF